MINKIIKPINEQLTDLLCEPAPSADNLVLLSFKKKIQLTCKNFMSSTLVTGSPGSGKTTLAQTILFAMMRALYGGVILVVKATLVQEVETVAKLAGRSKDLIILKAGGPHCYNPLEELTDPTEIVALLGEISEALQDGKPSNVSDERFWNALRDITLRRLCIICRATKGRVTVPALQTLFHGLPSSPGQLDDPEWQRTSKAWPMLRTALGSLDRDVANAAKRLVAAPSAANSKIQESIHALISVVLDKLSQDPLRSVFGKQSTFSMSDIISGRKILVVDMPTLASASGRIANILCLFCFCRCVTDGRTPRDTFLLADEFQELVTPGFARFLSLQRESRVAPVLLTQNLALLEARVGKDNAEALCGNIAMKIFCRQDHAATRQWACEQIDKKWVIKRTHTMAPGNRRTTTRERVQEYRVQSNELAVLKPGESVILHDGQVWRSKWPPYPGSSKGGVRVAPPIVSRPKDETVDAA